MASTKPLKPETIVIKPWPMRKGQYIGNSLPKKLMFLHHTAGMSAKSAINWWNQTADRVGTAFVIDRDGIIYQTFPADEWAYHLGVKGDNDYIEKSSIGIEIVSAGRVRLVGDKYMFYPVYPNLSGAKEVPEAEVIQIKKGRWEGYWHKYTDAQVEAVIGLVDKLRKDFKITIQKDFSEKTLEYNADIVKKELTGLFGHSSVRTDKVDIFPQANLIEGLKSLI